MTCVVDSSYLMRLADAPADPRARRVHAIDAQLWACHEILAPELVNYELLHAVHRREVDRLGRSLADRQGIVARLLDCIEFVPAASGDRELIGRLVEEHGISAYDAAFLALAKSRPDALFVTLDERLHEAAAKELGDRALDLDGLEAKLAVLSEQL